MVSAIHRTRISKTHCLFIFILISVQAFSQTWSEPVIISTTGFNLTPNFTVDRTGRIHCVWIVQLGEEFSRVFYSYSTDQGVTWTKPVSITSNEDLYITDPHITADADLNLYVSYNYKKYNWPYTPVCYVKFDSKLQEWLSPVILGHGAMSQVVVDSKNLVHFFWAFDTEYCRILDGDSLYNSFLPYPTNEVLCRFQQVTIDRNDNIHACGPRRYDSIYARLGYFRFKDNHWQPFIDLSDKPFYESWVCVDKYSEPWFVWRQVLPNLYNYGTFYCQSNNGIPNEPIFLDSNASRAAMVVDNLDQVHLVENINRNNVPTLVYKKFSGTEWISIDLESSIKEYLQNILRQAGGHLYLAYFRLDTIQSPTPNYYFSEIRFRKLDIPDNVQVTSVKTNVNIFPNPFSESINIKIPNQLEKVKSIEIFDISGNSIGNLKALYSNSMAQEYSFTFSKEDIMKMPKGFYIIKIELSSGIFNSVIIHN